MIKSTLNNENNKSKAVKLPVAKTLEFIKLWCSETYAEPHWNELSHTGQTETIESSHGKGDGYKNRVYQARMRGMQRGNE